MMSRGVALRTASTLENLASAYGGDVDAEARGRRVARLIAAREASTAAEAEQDLVVVLASRFAGRSAAAGGLFLCTPQAATHLPHGRRWVHPHAQWAMARLLCDAEEDEPADPTSSGAQVSPMARVDSSARIMVGATILGQATIGADSVVEPNAVIYSRVEIGKRVRIGACSVIGRPGFGWTRAPTGELYRVPQIGGVLIEDDVQVGALCTVDAGTLFPTRLRAGVRLDAHVHVGHNVELGSETLVAAQTGFAGSARVGARVRLGGQAGVADHVDVGDDVAIAAKTGVVRDVPDGQVVAGFPAVPRVRWLRAMATLFGGNGRLSCRRS